MWHNSVMSREKVRIRYDGPALAEQSIDIDDLAPALLAIGELCKLANRRFNGDRASVKVLVNAELDQNCFELNLELIQTLLDQARSIMGNEEVATAKELLEWLGILAPPSIGVLGTYTLLKVLGNRKIASKELQVQDGKDVVQIIIEGNNNSVYIHPQTNELLKDPAVFKNVQKTLKPLTKEGYETLEFETNDGQKEEVTKDEAKEILDVDFSARLDLTEHEEHQIITAWIRVYAPVYEETAKNWKFEFGERHETIDISETDIAANAIERGGALVNDTYKVRLGITQIKTSSGKFRNRYKIEEVLEFHAAKLTQQEDMFNKDES